jgi:CubicO group peptidase (beta-lactamase class C family)
VRDRDGRPWQADTMAPSYSTTKGVAATLVHILVDRGLLDYDDRVAKHWPEFAQNGKARITLRQVLAHQSGLYHIRQMIDHADRMLDWDYMVRAIERAAPIHPPGERTGYHGLTFGFLVGEILQRATGRSFAQLVEEELVKPLQLDGMYVGAPEQALGRAAELISGTREWDPQWLLGQALVRRALRQLGPALAFGARLVGMQIDLTSLMDALAPRGISSFDFGAEQTLRVSIPAANGLFTARSLARMYAALAGAGELDGVRLLSRGTLARATEPQAEARERAVIPIDMRWRLGYHAVFTTCGVPRRGFGHFGFGGSGGWADPSRDLAVAMIVNSGIGTPFGDLRIARISGAALAAANRREQSERAAA